MMTRAALCAALLAGAAFAGCGTDDEAPKAKEPATPTYVETEACRTSATSMLADAETAAASTDSDEIGRYLAAVRSAASGLQCTANVTAAATLVVGALTAYQRVWLGCELEGQFVDWDGDGEPDGTGSCSEADQPFAELKSKIAAARTAVDAKE